MEKNITEVGYSSANAAARRRQRRGSTLLVVIALTGMLALLGVMFFSFASQELESARNFNQAGAVLDDPELGPDIYFNHALRQITEGPGPNEKNSALWGGRHSILANAFGRDAHPNNGSGVFMTANPFDPDAPFNPIVDVDHNLATANPPGDKNGNWWQDPQTLLGFNDSPAANYGQERNFDALPAPDVDYTYPDINTPFLAYRGYTRNPSTGELELVIKPSFHRPELLASIEDINGDGTLQNEDTNGNGVLDSGEDTNGNGVLDIEDFDGDGTIRKESATGGTPVWEDGNFNGILDSGEDSNGNGILDVEDLGLLYGDTSGDNQSLVMRDPRWAYNGWTRNRVMRAHPGHIAFIYDYQTGAAVPTPVPRYLDDRAIAGPDAAIISALPGGSGGFQFEVDLPEGTNPPDGIPNEQGVWSFTRPTAGQSFQYEYDTDNDGDGERDGILMDMDFPVQERPSDGARYIPMFSTTIYDADGLFNLNIHGNLSGDTGAAPYYGGGQSISRSLHGLSPAEVNPTWGLSGHPGVDVDVASLSDYSTYFNHAPVDRWELANMSWWWLNKGRVDFGSGTPKLHVGRLGEANRIWTVLQASGGSNLIALNNAGNYHMFPFPGVWNQDDNRNFNEGGAGNTASGRTRAFGHPMSFSGRGSFTNKTNSTVARRPLLPRLYRQPGTPVQFPQYEDMGLAGDVTYRSLLSGNLMLNPSIGMLGGTTGGFFPTDDMLEISLEPRSLQRPQDEPFSLEDSAVLQLSNTDVSNTGVTSRLTDLLPSHIDPQNNSTRAVDIRKMFTTSSWGRKQFGMPRFVGGFGTDTQPGEAGVDDNRDGVVDNYLEISWPGTDDDRAWEFNVDLDGDGLPEFPPAFPGVGSYGGYRARGIAGRLPTAPTDPFRAPVRRLIEVENGNRDQLRYQFKLSVNYIIDAVRNAQQPGHPAYSPIEFRPLTPHPNSTGMSGVTGIPEITAGSPLPPYPPRDSTQAEWWARYDRQRMARDIYVLLYTLCGGDNSHNTTLPNTGPQAYSRNQMHQMAQFAVNVVDSIDRDHTMTMFEYDMDLNDGWGLDDQAWDSTGDPQALPAASSQRGVVYGVEEQQLAFSEALWVHQNKLSANHEATVFDDSLQDYHFLYAELQNMSPRTAQLATSSSTSATTAIWRMRRKFAHSAGSRQQALGSVELALDTADIPSGEEAMYFRSGTSGVGAGDMFTIATCDKYGPGTTHVSTFYINDDFDTGNLNFDPIIPRAGSAITAAAAGSAPPLPTTANPGIDLDMTFTAPGTTYDLVNRPGIVGGFLNSAVAPAVGSAPQSGSLAEEQLVLVLERRLNPEAPTLSLSENPWVTVDAIYVPRREFALRQPDTSAEIGDRLDNLTSVERAEPLLANSHANYASPGKYSNSIHTNPIAGDGINSRTTSVPYSRYQRQLNRDFASVGELFSISLRGPKTLTYALGAMERSPFDQQTTQLLAPVLDEDRNGNGALDSGEDLNGDGIADYDEDLNGNGVLDTHEDGNLNFRLDGGENKPGNGVLDTTAGPTSAGAMFLQSNHSLATADPQFDNHWHRLLAFMEVPTRTHRQLGNPLTLTRVPGLVNINTIRHPEVMAGVIDDNRIYTAPEEDINGNGSVDPFEDFSLPANGQFDFGLPDRLEGPVARDHWFDMLQTRDGFDPVSYMVLPGTSASRPFRDFGSVASGTGSVEDTILRSHPRAALAPSLRRLFELGTNAQSNGGMVDSGTRYQVISKLMNNVTTRSNVFFVFLTVQFHEAYEDPTTGAVRIGGRFDLDNDGNPDNDEHRGFFIIDRSAAEEAYDPGRGEFDWKDLVKYRLTIN